MKENYMNHTMSLTSRKSLNKCNIKKVNDIFVVLRNTVTL